MTKEPAGTGGVSQVTSSQTGASPDHLPSRVQYNSEGPSSQ